MSFVAMDLSGMQALVHAILRHPDDHAWRMQEIGLLGLRLDDRREYRMHLWDPTHMTGDPPVHDHPYDFTSTVVVGEMTNTRYEVDPLGVEHRRIRYSPTDEDSRRSDAVRLSGTPTVYEAGDEYAHQAHELHASAQLPGTVTIIRMAFRPMSELTVCTVGDVPWVSGQARAATTDEVQRFTAAALEWFD
jgi:hypothetical protein